MSNNFLNLEEIVKNWAWDEYEKTATASQKKLLQKQNKKKTKYIEQQIDWSSTRFNDTTIWSRLADDDPGPVANDTSGQMQQQQQQQQRMQQQAGPGQSAAPGMSILFETKFTNNTKSDQQYTMRTEKTTKSSLSTTVEEGLTRGFEMGLKLMTPCEVLEANAGYKREVTLTKIEGQTFEEELTWGVESVILVAKQHVAEASLVVNERKQSGKFEIVSRISGMVYVTFTNIKENNAFVKDTGNDIVDIVRKHKETHDLSFVKIQDPFVIVTTTGSCHFRYGVSQEVKVNQKPINVGEDEKNMITK